MPIPPDDPGKPLLPEEEKPFARPDPIPPPTAHASERRGGKRKNDTRQEARSAADEAAYQAREVAGQQQKAAAATLGGVASALRHASGKLDEEQHPTIARYASEAAGRVDDLARELHDQDLGSMMNRASRYAREHPVAVLAGALAAGYFVARMAKSTHDRAEEPTAAPYDSGHELGDEGVGESPGFRTH